MAFIAFALAIWCCLLQFPRCLEDKIMSDHIMRAYDQDLKMLADKITLMGELNEQALLGALHVLKSGDVVQAEIVRKADKKIDQLQREVEEKSIQTIALRQPMAIDLRKIIGTIRVASDLERVGDMAKNIAKRAIALEGQQLPTNLINGLEGLANLALERLHAVLMAYTNEDVAAALHVWEKDEDIDVLYNALFRELLNVMMQSPAQINCCTHLLFCAKNIERIGDHATNIAETLYYIAKGEVLADDRPKL
jgi:phosphate transport system protein